MITQDPRPALSKMETPGTRQQQQATIRLNPLSLHTYRKERRKTWRFCGAGFRAGTRRCGQVVKTSGDLKEKVQLLHCLSAL